MANEALNQAQLIEAHRRLLSENAALHNERDRLIAERDAAMEEAESVRRQLQSLEAAWAKQNRRLFGRSSEKLDTRQLLLFAEQGDAAPSSEPPSPPELAPDDESADEPPPARRKRRKDAAHGALELPLNIDTQVIEHPLDDLACLQCGAEMVVIGVDESTEVDYIPAQLVKKVHRRQKAACKECEECVARAPAPKRLLEKCQPGPLLACWILVAKYKDHLPLYRQVEILRRLGGMIPRSTLCDWVMKLADRLQPIVDAMKKDILAEPYVATDDTRVMAFTMQGGRRKLTQAYLWPYLAGNQVVFDFTVSRSRDGPEAFLGNYSGYLQSDDYAGYHRLHGRAEITAVGCMAHARRKLHEALVAQAPGSLVLPVIASIRRLYQLEEYAREEELSDLQRLQLRWEQSRPILATLLRQLRRLWKDPAVLPKSALGLAVAYMLRNWRRLTRYTLDAMLRIDNNAVENCIRPIALGRKNWLFAGSEKGGRAAACIYSLVQSCHLIGVPVDRYLHLVLSRLTENPQADPQSLTPKNCKAAIAAELRARPQPLQTPATLPPAADATA